MGFRVENHCVSCPPDLGCMGSICRNRNVRVFFCDDCKEVFQTDDLYLYETKSADYDLCAECYKERALEDAKKITPLVERGLYD